jgi:general secretion pathway protein J
MSAPWIRQPPTRLAKGFTLLEMLISMVLVGFVLVLLFAGLRLGTRSWDVAEARINASSQRAIVMNLIRTMLEQSAPLRWKVDGVETLAFEADSTALSFIGPIASREGLSGNHQLRLSLAEAESGRDLVLQWRLSDPSARDFSGMDEARAETAPEGGGIDADRVFRRR